MVLKLSNYKTDVHNDWCPGCGDFGILNAIQMALAESQIPLYQSCIFSGIGCSGKTPHYIHTNGIHTLHGRVLPFAQGAKLANPQLEIIAVGGDGDGLGIGVGHFVNAGRRNIDMTYIIFNNGVYGLTKGQAAPTLKLGVKTKSLTKPNVNNAINPISLALISGFTFVGRGYAYDIKHLKELIIKAMSHKGLAFLDVLQPCPTYNDINTKEWFQGLDDVEQRSERRIPRIYRLDEINYNGVVKKQEDSTDIISQAMSKSNEWGDRIPIGIFYQNECISTYEERISWKISDYLSNTPSKQKISLNDIPIANVQGLLNDMRAIT